MRPTENIEKLVRKLRYKASDRTRRRILGNVFKVLENNKKQNSANIQPNIWRIIMKSPITKLAAAAVIIITVALSIMFLDKSVTPAYALEQTIEAFKNVRFMHIVRRDEQGEIEDERWIELGYDGCQVRYRQDTPPNFLVVEDGKDTAVYYKDKQAVVLYDRKDKQYQWIGSLGRFLEDLRQEGNIIEENSNYGGKPAHKVLWPMMNAECYVDIESKLPIAIGGSELSYEQPPEGTFRIEVPEGFAIVDKRPGAEPADEPEWLTVGEDADKLFHQARYALISGDNQKASELFEYVVEHQPRRNWAWYWLGKAYYELGEYELAVEKFTRVIDMMGEQAYCNLARGLAYAASGKENEARQDLEKALPWMIRTLSEPSTGSMFEYADDPTLREGNSKPTERQLIERMIVRLRAATGMYFGYNFNLSPQENAEAIAAWQNWYEER